MAITRSQQAKQMLQDGGMLVKPSTDGKRPGYSNPNEDRAREEAADRREQASVASTQGRRAPTAQEVRNIVSAGPDDRGSDVQNLTQQLVKEGKTPKEIRKITGVKNPLQKAVENFFTNRRKQAYNFARSLPGAAKSSYNNLIAYRNYLKSQGADLTTIDRLLEGVDEETPIGFDAFQELAFNYEPKGIENIETLRDMLTDTTRGPFEKLTAVPQNFSDFMLTQRNNPNLFAAGDLGNFMNMTKPKDLVNPNTGELYTNAEFEELKREIGQDRGLLGGRDDTPMDPCLGPNPPAYCFIGDKADETQEAAVTRNLSGLTPRIGGSIFNFDNMADGGIAGMDREAFLLGGIAKGLKKAVRGVKKLVKSPIGKAALLGAVGFGIPGTQFGGIFGKGAASSFFGKGSFNPLKQLVSSEGFTGLGPSKFAQFLGKYGLADVSKMALTPKGAMAGIGLVSALAGLSAKPKDKDKFDLASYYAQNQLEPSQSIRGMGSEFDFYGGERMRVADGGDVEPVAKKTMPLIDMDGKEKDYRETGGFVDMGRMERADDVPARLSKNEFVFTADAVRNAGEGDIDKGAEVMYNMMKNLEAGGEVSEESQGLEGAREMFQTSQRLGEVI